MGNEPRIRLREEARSDVPRGRATPPNPGRRRRERVQRPAGARPLPPLPPRPRRISPRGRTRDGPTGTGFRGGGEIPSPLPFPLRGRGGGRGAPAPSPGDVQTAQERRGSMTTAGRWSRKSTSAQECVTTHLPNGTVLKTEDAPPPPPSRYRIENDPRAGPPGPRPSRVGGTRGSRFEVRRASVRA